MEKSRFDIPLGESEGEALAPISPTKHETSELRKIGPEWKGADDTLEPITISRSESAGLGKLVTEKVASDVERVPKGGSHELRSQRSRLRNVHISREGLAMGAGAVAGAALIGAFTSPAQPLIGATILAGAGAVAGGVLYGKATERTEEARERRMEQRQKELEAFQAMLDNNAR